MAERIRKSLEKKGGKIKERKEIEFRRRFEMIEAAPEIPMFSLVNLGCMSVSRHQALSNELCARVSVPLCQIDCLHASPMQRY